MGGGGRVSISQEVGKEGVGRGKYVSILYPRIRCGLRWGPRNAFGHVLFLLVILGLGWSQTLPELFAINFSIIDDPKLA